MEKIVILAYTKGMGSGHLTRINAIYKGFLRSNISVKFLLYAPRSKYLNFLESGIVLVNHKTMPKKVDLFVCDWKEDSFTNTLDRDFAKLFVGIRRLGKVKSTFPDHYYIFAIEPGVRGDELIWPIISTWRDEQKDKKRLLKITGIPENGKNIVLFAENGAYQKHPELVFNYEIAESETPIYSSNSPYKTSQAGCSIYPVAQYFGCVEKIVVGGGYNSVHEALCFANGEVIFVNVGGDDQETRIRKKKNWERPTDSMAHILAKRILELYKKCK